VTVVPEPSMEPPVAFQVTAVFDAFETVAVSDWVPAAPTVADAGLTDTLTGGAGSVPPSPPQAEAKAHITAAVQHDLLRTVVRSAVAIPGIGVLPTRGGQQYFSSRAESG
jgi:hypothetical protein